MTQYVLGLAATLPVVISDTEALYLYGLDILARQQSERLYYVHDGLGSVRQLSDSPSELGRQIAPYLRLYRGKRQREERLALIPSHIRRELGDW